MRERNVSIQCIVFDFDGTLANSNNIKHDAYYLIFESIRNSREIIDEILQDHFSDSRFTIIPKIMSRLFDANFLSPQNSEANLVSLYIECYANLCDTYVAKCPEVPGTLDSLASLHSDYRLFVNSGTPEDSLRRILESRKISHFFSAILGSPSSKIDNLNKILVSENLEGAEVIVIGDDRSDLQSAMLFNTHFIGIRHSLNKFDVKGLVMVDDLQSLHTYVNRIATGRLHARLNN